MKRTFAKRGFQSLLAMFFLVGGLFVMTANRVEAQSTLSAPANQTWKAPADAMNTLSAAVNQQHAAMSANPVGSNNYNNALAHAVYYKQIMALIDQGVAVGDAVTQARNGLSGIGRTDDEFQGIHFTKPLLNQLYADAKALLT